MTKPHLQWDPSPACSYEWIANLDKLKVAVVRWPHHYELLLCCGSVVLSRVEYAGLEDAQGVAEDVAAAWLKERLGDLGAPTT